MENYAPTNGDVIEEVKKRWSPRSFADKAVEQEKLAQLFAAARWAASSYNEQPWRYIVASKHQDKETYEKIFECFNDFNQQWAGNAPVAALGFVKNHFGDDIDQENELAVHDLGAASAQLSLQATNLDLYVHQMAGIEKDVINETFDVPEGFVPVTGMVIGYGGDPDELSGDLKDQEMADRTRQPMEDFVWKSWNIPAGFAEQE